MGEGSFFEEHVKKAKCTVWSETQISEETAKKANSAKSRPGKLQPNIGQHTDGMNVLRC